MHNPIKNYTQTLYPNGDVTQFFGENPQLYRPWGLKAHNGIDIVAEHGTPLLAVEDGTVIDVKLDPEGFGKHVRLLSKETDEKGVKRCWVYAHCANISVVVGSEVKAGDEVATMGNTGFVISGGTPFWGGNNPDNRGTHLHLGVRLVKLDEKGWRYNKDAPRITILNYDNGYKGAVNPATYLGVDPRIPLLQEVINLMQKVIVILRNKQK